MSTFAIQLPGNSQEVSADYTPQYDGKATVTYQVTNNLAYPTKGVATATALDGVGEVTVVGEESRDVGANKTTPIAIEIKIPKTAANGTYKFRLRVGNFDQPNVDCTDGDPVRVKWVQHEGRPRKWWPLILGAAAIVLVIVGLAIYFATRHSSPALVAVPNVVGDSIGKAHDDLTAAGLAPSTQPAERQGDAEVGVIIVQAPAAGAKVAKGTSVAITPQDLKPITIHSYKGQPEAIARAALTAQGLQLQESTVGQGGQPVGTVVDQEPGGGGQADVPPGSTVVLKVQGRPDPTPMPDIVGKVWTTDGIARMSQAKLVFNTVAKVTGTYAHGQVCGVSYNYQQPVPAGAVVTVYIEGVNLMNVVGQFPALAQATLAAQGFKVTLVGQTIDSRGIPATVTSMSPSPGPVLFGSTVTLSTQLVIRPPIVWTVGPQPVHH